MYGRLTMFDKRYASCWVFLGTFCSLLLFGTLRGMLPRLFASFMCFSHDFLFVLTDSAGYLQYRPYLIECWPFSKLVSRATYEGMRGFSEKQYLFLDRVGCRLAEESRSRTYPGPFDEPYRF